MRNEQSLQEAARWHARLQAADCSEDERRELKRWLLKDSLHAQHYALAERASAGVDALALDARLQALADKAFDAAARDAAVELNENRRAARRRWAIPATLAAGIALAVVAVQFSAEVTPHAVTAVAYETASGERRTISLPDGSNVAMDIDTKLLVRMGTQQRQIELVSGRAMFDVAHDASRPFSVSAAGSRTTALGTKFQVQHQDRQVVVTLAEGSVAIDGQSAARSWEERLSPGEQLSIDANTAARNKHNVDPQLVTSWTRGRHVFRGTPLGEAIQEVNRYAKKKIRLGDPALAAEPVGGNFIAGDSELVVAALAAVLPLRVVAGAGEEIILFRRYDAAHYDH